MPTTSLGVWTPGDTDDWDLTIDLAAMALSVDEAITMNASRIIGTDAQRLSASAPSLREGLQFYTTDTNREWFYDGSAWKPDGTSGHHNGNPGASLTGISIPAGAVALPRGVVIKTGMMTFTTSTAFGNEYANTITFASPFPNAVLSLQLTQIQVDGALAGSVIAYDSLNTSSFRAFYPNSTASGTKRSFSWVAIGY